MLTNAASYLTKDTVKTKHRFWFWCITLN